MNATGIARIFARTPTWQEGAAVCVAAVVGVLVAVAPLLAVALFGVALLAVATFVIPVGMLTCVLILTAIVPYGVQNGIGVGGGSGSPDLLVSDLIIVMGVARAMLLLLQRRLSGRSAALVVLVCGLLAATLLQTAHGLFLGRGASAVGAEARVLLAFGAALMTLPILTDDAARNRLLRAMAAVGLGVGLLGVAQWVFQIEFGAAGDFGVRQGVRLTSGGKGQIQGGMYVFPVAVIVAFAVLSSGRLRSIYGRIGVAAVLVLNAIALLLTFERTFWVATALGVGLVALRVGRLQRARVLVWGPMCLFLAVAALATVAPGELTTARERLLSIGQYSQDSSLRARVLESRHVIDEVEQRPVIGSGFGATITWGRPWEGVRPRTTAYSHNGYLWLAWKMGIPVALLLTLALLTAGLARDRFRTTSVFGAVRNGCQGALVAILIVSVTFPAYNSGSITAAIGMMLAICIAPHPVYERPSARSRSAAPSGAERGDF